MKIIKTNITTISNDINNAKIKLAEKIISNIQPLLSELHSSNYEVIINLENEYNISKKNINKEKEKLEEKVKELNKKRKVKNLLNRISKLMDSGLIYEGSLKSEFVILIKTINFLDEKTIERHLKETMTLIAKRFSKKI